MSIDAHGFVNRIRSLHNLDHDDVQFIDHMHWPLFRDSPVEFLMRCDDATCEMIWQAVEARQTSRRAS